MSFYRSIDLIDNAIKYSLKVRGRYLPIEVSEDYDSTNDFLIYSITNFGEPPDENAEELFKLGVRGSNSRKFHISGTGEGLARCKEIFDRHAGFIRMSVNRNSKSTEIKITINISKNILL